MITALEIENYRGIKHCRIEDLKQVNILIGRNNAGKSSILEALYLASAAFRQQDILMRNKYDYLINRRGLREKGRKDALYYNYNSLNIPLISTEISFHELFAGKKTITIHTALNGQVPHIKIIDEGKVKEIILSDDGVIQINDEKQKLSQNEIIMKLSQIFNLDLEEMKNIYEFFANAIMIDEQLIRTLRIIEKALWKKYLREDMIKILLNC